MTEFLTKIKDKFPKTDFFNPSHSDDTPEFKIALIDFIYSKFSIKVAIENFDSAIRILSVANQNQWTAETLLSGMMGMDDGKIYVAKFCYVPEDRDSSSKFSMGAKEHTALKERYKLRLTEFTNVLLNAPSIMIGCKRCGSKMNRAKLKETFPNTHFCPICKNDLFNDTYKSRLSKFETKIDFLEKKLFNEFNFTNDAIHQWQYVVGVDYIQVC